ncbi:cupin domain-containing protein [Boudabousia marimammalium]|uniref:Cupin n=1 Tax=Boudabousia marimammalium TaxID=156892 RepID=A0A1Q5PKG6_9ACTO|nr:cupin domain-containing protein [Boudabousia marimammalium]OKL46713.1 cupin [Boudabousia marimammalium]
MPSTPVSQSSFHTGLFDKLPILEAATTSRMIVNNDVLRHVLFSFDAGQVLTEHASPRAVIVNLLSGSMRFTIGDQETLLAAGDVVYLAPGDRHALEALSPCHMSLTLVKVTESETGTEAGTNE